MMRNKDNVVPTQAHWRALPALVPSPCPAGYSASRIARKAASQNPPFRPRARSVDMAPSSKLRE